MSEQAFAHGRRSGLPRLCLVLLLAALAVAGCGRDKADRDLAGAANILYERGNKALGNGNYQSAVFYFEQLEARFPFSDEAKQAQLDLMYAYYRNEEVESAIDAADNFIRENPTHPRIDYAYYIKGLVYFDEPPGVLERIFRVDVQQRPPKTSEQSYLAFSTLVERFPDSRYAADARERMIFLRNRMARYQLYVAEWYVERGAYIAALNRARRVIEEYEGSTSAYQAMEVMLTCYEELGLPDLAEEARKTLAANENLKKKRRRLLP